MVRTVPLNLLCLALLAALWSVATKAAPPEKSLKIGMAKSFRTDQPKAFIEIASDDFKTVMKKTTGLTGDVATQYDALEVAEKLNGKEIDVGIFHAPEFGWVKKKHPDLEAILIAAGKIPMERVYLIVNQKLAVKTFADLRGKTLDVPIGTKEYARLFLGKHCAENKAKDSKTFFGSISQSKSRNDALDQVARGKADVTAIDQTALEFYKELKAAVFDNNLRILDKSEEFPPVAIVVKKGALDPATLKQFRDGLLKADKDSSGREMMNSWGIKAFEPVPKDYEEKVAEITKAYPKPMP